jgi:hypothetical protein
MYFTKRGNAHMAEIKYIKEYRSSDVYEVGDYEIRVPKKVKYSSRTEKNEVFSEDEGDMLSNKTITIKNKKIGESSTRKCYQSDDSLLEELENDYNGPRSQFNWK